MKGMTYSDAGVDIELENRSIDAMRRRLTFSRKGFGAPLTGIGHYAGLIDMGEFAIAMTTDGVGSKILIANAMRKWDTIGIDCIAMNVNDLLAIGAEPLAFVDYLAVERVDPEVSEQIAVGLQKGAEISNISIVGGETASLPEMIRGLDLAGTAIGYVKKEKVITGEKVRIGDAVVGVPSTGLHSNGYTLARRIIESSGYTYFDKMPGDSRSIGEILLTPTRIYIEVLELLQRCDVHGLAHITGSGLLKLHRITDLGFEITDPIEPHPVFKFLQELGGVDDVEMYRTFNMGMGFVVVLPEEQADDACRIMGPGSKVIGRIVESGLRTGGIRLC
ncbi:MAG: phosphoribosylformylglycinamidine cyclo-ligase [Methanothrix sp.]|jgi:phosphoribosylformylglycinamidine cyclo-ligase (EC 6.3.3.1)|uniref:Phosphoribosylformylglycinamidine cyclo-ligase n=1 Tax=Methanothrix thermoacetophila (strain DSM 6194 / JCM 14653 / NBRC 101360 / PT) TaxID=349307 RepID=A0B8K7_METTP|nr:MULTISPECIES: phosphoribosylformylglycinamidine cyclo-ligase [Methanothrix]ABK15031.1 phosphoribosylformylglycinamidine cyclo-ligase [Methanothrix thermoacetophila PT]MBC7079386.1 phosphoribosylformylglycinamidine cyclo-ligase [Methanothrix sp.]NPU86853.1 phosphoribosylformylglycinamidine cyclo-ligase [Methanothrix sp.]